MEKMRSSNIELLRILGMITIVAHHLAVHSKINFAIDTANFNHWFLLFYQMGGKIAVNIFMIISGYFMVLSTNAKIQKIKLMRKFYWMMAAYMVAAISIVACEKRLQQEPEPTPKPTEITFEISSGSILNPLSLI